MNEPRGSKYPTFKDSGPKYHKMAWFLEPETSNIGCLDPPRKSKRNLTSGPESRHLNPGFCEEYDRISVMCTYVSSERQS